LWRGLRGTFNTAGKTILALSAFVVAAAFTASHEFHQSFVPSRTASMHDVMLDCIGAFVAVLFCVMFARARSRQAAEELYGRRIACHFKDRQPERPPYNGREARTLPRSDSTL
jgi:hypothetical protein